MIEVTSIANDKWLDEAEARGNSDDIDIGEASLIDSDDDDSINDQ